MTARQLTAVRALLAAIVLLDLLVGVTGVRLRTGDGSVTLGRPPLAVQQPLPGPTIPQPATAVGVEPGPPRTRPLGARAEPSPRGGLRQPDAQPYGPAIAFDSEVAVPEDLLFVLVAGSDARPGERVDRSRADSIHLLAINPRSGTGTVLGFPRDSWVEIPGHGTGKINTAMAIGGPDLLAETVQRLTGLPVHWWVVTGFDGLVAMVDALDRVVINVERRMADKASGAFFERGHHNLSGREVLAFARDRKSVARGDFTRSENQGVVILAALAKMRTEVGDMDGVRRWVDVLWRHVRIDAPLDEAVRLGAVVRRVDPAQLANVVAPGEIGDAGRQSVVYLSEEAAELFTDLRDDATLGAAPPPTTTTTSTSSTTTTTLGVTSTSTSTTSTTTTTTTVVAPGEP